MSVIYEEFKGFSVERKRFTQTHTMGVPHYHHAYEIFLPVEGMMTLLIGDEIIATDNTNVIVTQKGIPHGNFSKSEHERVVIYFDDDFLNMFLTEHSKKALLSSFERKIVTPDKYAMKRLREITKKLEDIFLTKETLPEIFVLLNEMLIIIHNSPNAQKQEIHRINSTLGSILTFITLRFSEIQSVKELSERFFISEAYLCRLFKDGMGVTVTEYINTLRINEACDRLKNSEHTMTEIAADVGYNSYTYFCKIFKKLVGESPYEYRKNIKGL
ncbi:MAG: helix-turn-helix domain-containing protein [Clostridia bacterium]|nr:helix-turn-helix domain-containing protein [Clostridia bacterium]